MESNQYVKYIYKAILKSMQNNFLSITGVTFFLRGLLHTVTIPYKRSNDIGNKEYVQINTFTAHAFTIYYGILLLIKAEIDIKIQ